MTAPAASDPWPLLYGAYEFIKANVAPETSNTARLLCAPDGAMLRARLADELVELAGVLEGTHRHKGLPDDLILEASQVCYWTFVQAVAANYALAEISAIDTRQAAPELILHLRQLAAASRTASQHSTSGELSVAWGLALVCCRAVEIDPTAPCIYDLDQMRGRAYMQPYFASIR